MRVSGSDETQTVQLWSTPVSKLAASTKPSLGAAIGWSLPLFVPVVPFVSGIFSSLSGEKDASPIFWIFLLTGWAFVVAWLVVKYQAYKKWARRNALDYSASQALDQRLHDLGGHNEPLSDRSTGMRIIQGATVGEISQHFDQRVSASISGWLQHELGFHGWGGGVSVGRVGLGIGQVGISGVSSVDLDVSGVIRDNLGGDAFIAVLEQEQPNGMIDTIRIIVPSEPACREYIAHLLSAVGPTFGAGSHVDATFQRYAPPLAASFPCDVPHVSDQLRAVLRQPPERRPTVAVVGEDLGGWAILGGAIRFGADGLWQQLFPLSFTRAILSAAESLRKNYTDRFLQPGKEFNTT